MSTVVESKLYIMHSDLGPVITQVDRINNYDVEDIIHTRAIAQGRAVQFLNLGKQASPNDPTAARTITSGYSSSLEELA